MKCSSCDCINRPGRLYCGRCGSLLAWTCPRCQFGNTATEKYCGKCGQPITQSHAISPASSTSVSHPIPAYTPAYLTEHLFSSESVVEGERKHVSVLFCDLVNSTPLAEQVGPDGMHHLLKQFFNLALSHVHQYEGRINQFLGDGFMALFGAPIALEDHARRAALTALAMRDVVTTLSHSMPTLQNRRLSVRMGINTGLVVVGGIGDNVRMDYTAIGDTTNLAARLQQLAEPNSICVSEQFYSLTHEYFSFESLGALTIKGKAERESVYKLIGPRLDPGAKRRSIKSAAWLPMVGREQELTTLLNCVERLEKERWGQFVSITGGAGFGKSRLLAEVREYCFKRRLAWLEGRGISYGQTISYRPFHEMVRAWAGILESDTDVAAWKKFSRSLTSKIPDQYEELLPYIGTFMGLKVPAEYESRIKFLDAEALRNQIFLSTRRLFQSLAQHAPIALVFEDAHWIDQSSLNLIEHLLPLIEKVPILFFMVSRKEPDSINSQISRLAAESYPPRYTEVFLQSLTPEYSTQLVKELFPTGSVSPQLHQLISAKAEGNPLFLQEVTRCLRDMKAINLDPSSNMWISTLPPDQIVIPDTLQGVINSRIDRLPTEAKEILRIASVIGRTFSRRVLENVIESADNLDKCIETLALAELIRQRGTGPDTEYIFCHQLVQDAVYDTLLIDRRRKIHERVGKCIESLFLGRLEECSCLLAYHFALAENWRKALQYLLKAGDEAGKVAADTEALTHYQEALKAYTKQSDNKLTAMERATLERKMGEALFRRGEHRQAAEYLHRALSCLNTSYPKSSGAVRMAVLSNIFVQASHRLIPRFSKNSQRMADDAAADRSWILEMLGWMDYFGNQERFVLDALLALNLDERDNYEPGVARDSTAVGLITDLLPLHGLGHFYHQRAVTLAEQIQHPVAMGLAYLGRGLHHHHRTGRWTAAVEDYRRSIAAYKNAGHLRGWGGALWWFAWLQFMQGELATAMQCFSDIMQVGSDVADRQVYGWGLRGVGRLLSERGQWSEAVTHLQQGIDVLQTVPDYSSVARTMSTLGLCYLHQGKIEEGLVLVEKSQALVVKQRLYGFLSSETRLAVPEAYLFAAELGKGSRRESSLAMAAQACRLALQQTRVDREAGPGAFRYRGVLEWLQGNPKQAEQWWRKSIDTARQLGARYELAKVYLEMGLRAAPRHYLDEGKKLFEEVGEGASHLLTTDLGIVESEHHAKVN